MKTALVATLLVLASTLATADDSTGEVKSLAPGSAPAAATLAQMKGLQGDWITEGAAAGFSAPLAGQIVGHLTIAMGNEPFVAEIWILRSDGGSILLRQKHFGADLKPLQKPEQWLERKLVALAPDKLFFEDLTFITERDALVMKVKLPAVAGKAPQIITYAFHRAR